MRLTKSLEKLIRTGKPQNCHFRFPAIMKTTECEKTTI